MTYWDSTGREDDRSLFAKLSEINWFLVSLLTLVGAIGFAMLYSAAHGSFEPWAVRHAQRFALGLLALIFVAKVATETRQRKSIALPPYP